MHFAGRVTYTLYVFTRIIIEQHIIVVTITSKQQMDNFKTNKFGRSYISGKPLSDDFRVVISDTIIEKWEDSLTDYIPVTYSEISKRCSVSQQTVAKYGGNFAKETVSPYNPVEEYVIGNLLPMTWN